MKKETIKVIYKEPDKEPEVREIVNTLDTFQALVEGYIETVRLTKDAIIICNEEGKLNDTKANIWIPQGDVIFGPVVVVGDAGEDFGDVPEEKVMDILAIEELYMYHNKHHSRFD